MPCKFWLLMLDTNAGMTVLQRQQTQGPAASVMVDGTTEVLPLHMPCIPPRLRSSEARGLDNADEISHAAGCRQPSSVGASRASVLGKSV